MKNAETFFAIKENDFGRIGSRQSYERNFGVIKDKIIIKFLDDVLIKFKLNNCIVMIKIEVTQKSSNLRLIPVSFTTNILL